MHITYIKKVYKMSKENEIELMSFTEDGQRWLQCKSCYEYQKLKNTQRLITCSRCTMINTIEVKKPMDEFFKTKSINWKTFMQNFMNEFVDKDGNVFHKGKEQPDLKGTLPPTKVKPRKKKKKLTLASKII